MDFDIVVFRYYQSEVVGRAKRRSLNSKRVDDFEKDKSLQLAIKIRN